ncbi:MAG TPA: phytanoyl-CoA dioxygenase family protein [Gaiellaceae bacterium]|jgi:hypothetical protein|nr:phytanoyl-CoA dioxygenase family protein [Gaiellaceae bacterium]
MTTRGHDPTAVENAVAKRGFAVLRDAVPSEAVDAALRHMHLDLVRNGLPADRLGSWLWGADWFPHLKWDPPIAALAWWLPEELREGELCDPQILLQPPDDCDEQELVPHVDSLPEWAGGRDYLRIVGVALSPARAANGGLVVWPFDGEPEPVELEPGDALVMHPRLPHSSGINRQGGIRYAVYFRFLEPGRRM